MAPFKWIKPDVYPLFVFIGGAVAMAGFSFGRLLTSHPNVWFNKEEKQTGLHYNYKEGERYYNHALRRYLTGKKTEMMPGINEYFVGKSHQASDSK